MSHAELVALLREARVTLEYVGQVPTGERNSRARALERRIDAALAQAQPAEGFQVCEFCKGSGTAPVKKAWSPESVLGRQR